LFHPSVNVVNANVATGDVVMADNILRRAGLASPAIHPLIVSVANAIFKATKPIQRYNHSNHIMVPQRIQFQTCLSATAATSYPTPASSTKNPYLIDQIHAMQRQESTSYKVSTDYLNTPIHEAASTAPSPTLDNLVNPTDRETLCSWAYNIIDACELERQIAVIAMTYLDRFMASKSHRAQFALLNRRQFQLAFVTCLIISLKSRAGMKVESDFVSEVICQQMYQPSEIVDMEKEVLMALDWRLNGPCVHDFVQSFVELVVPSDEKSSRGSSLSVEDIGTVQQYAEIQAESAMTDYLLALQDPSAIAFASLLCAMQSLNVPLCDRYSFIQSVAAVTGLNAADLKVQVICNRLMNVSGDDNSHLSSSLSPTRTSSNYEQQSGKNYRYVSPVSSNR
jgi:hypothetical protein